MTNKIKEDIRIIQVANGFVVEIISNLCIEPMASKVHTYVFQSFELMTEWLRQYYLDDELKHVGHIRTNEAKPYILGGSDPE